MVSKCPFCITSGTLYEIYGIKPTSFSNTTLLYLSLSRMSSCFSHMYNYFCFPRVSYICTYISLQVLFVFQEWLCCYVFISYSTVVNELLAPTSLCCVLNLFRQYKNGVVFSNVNYRNIHNNITNLAGFFSRDERFDVRNT